MPEEAPQIDILKIATLSRLSLTEEEVKSYSEQLKKVLEYIDTLARYDVGEVEPTAHALPVYDALRKDEARPGFTQEEALANAPKRVGDQFQIPKVIETE